MFKRSLSEFLDKQTEKSKTEAILRHAESCKSCAETLQYMRNMKEVLASMGQRVAPVDCWSAVRARIVLRDRRPSWKALFVKYALAPSIAVLILAGYLFVVPQITPGQLTLDAPEPPIADFMNIHGSAATELPFSDSETYFIAAGMQVSGVR